MENLKQKTLIGLLWSFLERAGTQVVSFVVSIILARILMPDDYGTLALVLVFVNISDVFVVAGMGSALVQRKDVSEADYSSIFWLSFALSIILYGILFMIAPWVSRFYNIPILCPILRVIGLKLPFAAFNTVQRAIVSRAMQFKTYFYASISAVSISAIVGLLMAYRGCGVWSLVGQQLTNSVVSTFVVAIFVRWYPRILFDLRRVKSLFNFAWKLLVGQLIDTFFNEFRNMYVGKCYSTTDLAYYNRGYQFPHLIINNVNSSISAVLFPALSKNQNDLNVVRNMTRRAIKTSSFIILPLMFGLIAVAEPLVQILLTDKWMPCVPFVRIICLDMALIPIQTSNLQAIYATGRSDIGLKLNIIKKSVALIVVIVTGLYSVKAMAWGCVGTAIFATIVNSYPNKRLLGYGYFEQISDILPSIILASIMGGIVFFMNAIALPIVAKLILQIITGMIIYVFSSIIFKVEEFHYLVNTIMKNRK